MIFRKAITRELAMTSGGAALAILGILLVSATVTVIARSAVGKINPEAMLAFLALQTIQRLPIVLAIAVFFAVLLTFSRMYRDSEMAVWFSSGLSITAWVRPVLEFAAPVALVAALLSFVVSPWATQQVELFVRSLDGRSDASYIRPGVFTQAPGSDQVFFVDQVSSDKDGAPLRNVFVQSWRDDALGVMAAQSGYLTTTADGVMYAVLQNGRRYEGTPGNADFKQFDFEKLSIRLKGRVVKQGDDRREGANVLRLLGIGGLSNASANDSAGTVFTLGQRARELHARLAVPISLVLMALVAIPLAFVNPRAGRSWNLIFAILIFFIYYNLLSTAERLVESGKISPYLGLFPVHGVMIVLVLSMFAYRLLSLRFLVRGR